MQRRPGARWRRWQHRDVDIIGVSALEPGERATWDGVGVLLGVLGLVLAVAGGVLLDNPRRLLIIDEHVGLLLSAVGLGIVAVAVGLLRQRQWQPWVGGLGNAILVLEFIAVCAVGALYAIGSTFGQARTVRDVRVDDHATLRVQRLDGVLSSCSRLDLLVGNGWSTKHNLVTSCVSDDLQQLVVTVAAERVRIALPSGAICVATVDHSGLALLPVEASAACDTLDL
jgi:hypothetical protein